jgi:glycosyltransferase 2 family protein
LHSAALVPAPGRSLAEHGAQPARALWAWLRPAGGVAILTFLLWRLGTGPFVDGLRLINGWVVVAALGIGAVTTVCCAYRWSLVATGLGVRLPLRTAIADCYRSLFLNATLPGGVLGDVHRAVSHGRDVGDVGRGVRAVVWERTAGQVVQLGMATVVLFAFASPVQSSMPVVAAVVLALVVAAAVLATMLPNSGLSRRARAVRAAQSDIRNGLFARRNGPRIVLASAVAVSCHLLLFVIAARTAGSAAPVTRLVPLTLLALLAMGLPANVGGFGPREGVAAWAFGAAGMTAGQGVATAIVYGALVLVSSLPGAAVLVVRRLRVPATISGGEAAVPPAATAEQAAETYGVERVLAGHAPMSGSGAR